MICLYSLRCHVRGCVLGAQSRLGKDTLFPPTGKIYRLLLVYVFIWGVHAMAHCRIRPEARGCGAGGSHTSQKMPSGPMLKSRSSTLRFGMKPWRAWNTW